MKTLLLILVLICTTAQSHESQDYIKFVQENGFWAMTEKSNKLVFCFGVDYNNKPTCTSVPKQYIVIELPSNLQHN